MDTVDALVQLSFTVQGMVTQVGAEHDLSLTQLRMLGVLRGRRPGMQELGTFLGLDKSSVSGLVDRAERRGLVERAQGETDRRAVTVALSQQGLALAAVVEHAIGTRVAELLGVLDARQERDLTRLASLVVEAATGRPPSA